jgi:hypothetical protein
VLKPLERPRTRAKGVRALLETRLYGDAFFFGPTAYQIWQFTFAM